MGDADCTIAGGFRCLTHRSNGEKPNEISRARVPSPGSFHYRDALRLPNSGKTRTTAVPGQGSREWSVSPFRLLVRKPLIP